MSTTLTILLVGIASLLWFGLAVWVPHCLRSLYRYRLWSIRDAIVDAVLEGRIPNSDAVRHFTRTVEMAVKRSSHLTLLRFLLFPKPPMEFIDYRKAMYKKCLAEMTDEQRRFFETKRSEFAEAVLSHMLLGCVSGWLVLTLGLLAIVPIALVRSATLRVSRVCRNVCDNVTSAIDNMSKPFVEGSINGLSALAH